MLPPSLWALCFPSPTLPDVSFPAVSLPVYHFGAHPVGGASDRLDSCSRHADGLDPLAGSEVSELDVPRRVSQDVGTWWDQTKPAQLPTTPQRAAGEEFIYPTNTSTDFWEMIDIKSSTNLWWWNIGRLTKRPTQTLGLTLIPSFILFILFLHFLSTPS